ncbi:MAG: hypothetical protein ACI9S8_000731 [Chlamydiales bacterium]
MYPELEIQRKVAVELEVITGFEKVRAPKRFSFKGAVTTVEKIAC